MGENELDLELVKRVQRGDKTAFDLLVRKYQHRIGAVIGRFVPDHAEAQDIAQESLIRAYRAIGNFRGDSQFYTWLYRIAVNTAKNHLPTSDVEAEDAEHVAGAGRMHDHDTPEHELLREEIAREVSETVAALPEELRQAITLREMDGLSYEEIAETMDCPIGTVRSRIFRAREAVAEQLRPQMGTSKDRRW